MHMYIYIYIPCNSSNLVSVNEDYNYKGLLPKAKSDTDMCDCMLGYNGTSQNIFLSIVLLLVSASAKWSTTPRSRNITISPFPNMVSIIESYSAESV